MDAPKLIISGTTIDLNNYNSAVTPKWGLDKIIHKSVITGKITVVNKADTGKGRFTCEIVVYNSQALNTVAIGDTVDFYLFSTGDIHFTCIVKDVLPFASGEQHLISDSTILILESQEFIYNPLKVATPVANPTSCNFTTPPNLSVTLTCETPGATIYYTTDGSDPDTGDTEYTAPLSLSSTTTVKAKAYLTGMNPSNIMTEVYTHIPT